MTGRDSTAAVAEPVSPRAAPQRRPPGPRRLLGWSTDSIVLPACIIASAMFVLHVALVVPNYFFVDDYPIIVRPDWAAEVRWATLHDLRFSYLALIEFARFFGLDPYRSSVIGLVTGCLAFGFGGVFLLRAWIGDRLSLFAMACALVALLHPFWAELYQYRAAPFIIGIVFLLWTAAFYLSQRARLLAGIAVMAAALGLYQSAINQTAVAFLMLALLLLPTLAAPEVRRLRDAVIVIAGGVVLYGLVAAAVSHWGGVTTTDRARLLPLSHLAERARQVLRVSLFIFGKEDIAFASPYAKLLLGALALLVPVGQWRRDATLAANAGRVLAAFAIVAAAVLCINLAMLPLAEWWPTTRNLVSTGVLWAGLLLAASQRWPERIPGGRTVMALLVAGVVFTFSAVNDRFHTDLVRIGIRDAQMANRVAGRIEQLVGPATLPQSVVFINPPLYYPDMQRFMDLLVPGATTSWSEWAFMEEYLGWRLRQATDAERGEATRYCSKHGKWPAPDAVALLSQIAVVCQ